jgi:CheY-like chemotaxis protein
VEPRSRILIVDDEPPVRRMLVAALREKPVHIDVAGDGSEAIELLREHQYTVVLLDLMLPVVDGFAVLDAIGEGAGKPVVLVVSGADGSVLRRLDRARIHGIVRKPFDPVELADIVGACAEIRGRSAFETMAYATMLSGAPLLAILVK